MMVGRRFVRFLMINPMMSYSGHESVSLVGYIRLATTVDCRNPSESWTDVDGSRHSISWPSYKLATQQYLAIGQLNCARLVLLFAARILLQNTHSQ